MYIQMEIPETMSPSCSGIIASADTVAVCPSRVPCSCVACIHTYMYICIYRYICSYVYKHIYIRICMYVYI